jgi:hypothetical protein
MLSRQQQSRSSTACSNDNRGFSAARDVKSTPSTLFLRADGAGTAVMSYFAEGSFIILRRVAF